VSRTITSPESTPKAEYTSALIDGGGTRGFGNVTEVAGKEKARDHRNDHHRDAFLRIDRRCVKNASYRGINDEAARTEHQSRLDHRGESFRLPVPEWMFLIRGGNRHVQRVKSDEDGEYVEKAVRGLGEDADTAGNDGHSHLENDEADDHDHGKPYGARPGRYAFHHFFHGLLAFFPI